VEEKLNIIARSIYGADGAELTTAAKKKPAAATAASRPKRSVRALVK